MAAQTVAEDRTRALGGGMLAGLVGGAVMLGLLLALAAGHHADLWAVLKGPASPLLGARAARPGPDLPAALAGLACHLAVAAAWGALFGLLIYGLNRPATVIAGVLWGMLVWLSMFYLVLPALGMYAAVRATPPAAALLTHLAYGVATALAFLPFQRTLLLPAPELDDREPIAN